MGSPGAPAKGRNAAPAPSLDGGGLILKPLVVTKRSFGNVERDRKEASLRKYPFNVKVSEGARAGIPAISGLLSIPHKDWEQGLKS